MGFIDENTNLLLEDCYIVEVLLSFCIALSSELEWSLQEKGGVCVGGSLERFRNIRQL